VSCEVARLFDAMAPAYEELEPWYEHLYTRLHAILREVLAPLPTGKKARALDAGCGTGFQARLLDDLGYDTHAVDISAGVLAIAAGRLPGVAFTRASVEALPYADASFDTVTCCGSVLSFVAKPARAVAEIGRVLRPGGRLLVECEHKWSLDLAWGLVSGLAADALGYGISARRAFRHLARPIRDGFVADYPGYGALRFFTLAELDVMFGAAGITRQQTWGIHGLTNLIPSTVLHCPRLRRGVALLFAALCRADTALAATGLTWRFANSLVVLGQRDEPALR
jgi:SAM-dependent methyltransferase